MVEKSHKDGLSFVNWKAGEPNMEFWVSEVELKAFFTDVGDAALKLWVAIIPKLKAMGVDIPPLLEQLLASAQQPESNGRILDEKAHAIAMKSQANCFLDALGETVPDHDRTRHVDREVFRLLIEKNYDLAVAIAEGAVARGWRKDESAQDWAKAWIDLIEQNMDGPARFDMLDQIFVLQKYRAAASALREEAEKRSWYTRPRLGTS